MFGIGFWEIVLIGIVALIVVGPEKFPGMVKTTGFWLGRFREMATNVKQEFKHEIDRAEHLRQLVEEQQEILLRHSITDETKSTVPVQGVSAATPAAVPVAAPAPVAPVVQSIPAAPPSAVTVPPAQAPVAPQPLVNGRE